MTMAQTTGDDIDWITTPSACYIADDGENSPYYFANRNRMELNVVNSGVLEVKSDGRYRWQVGIRSDWALNMSLYMKNLWLNDGDQVVIETPSGDALMIYGTEDIVAKTLFTDVLPGDSIIVTVEGSDIKKSDFSIESVMVGFRNLPEHGENRKLKNLGDAASCIPNVTCYEEAEDVKQSVCRITFMCTEGNTMGTGVFVNNTSQDGAPYILTAAHSISGTVESYRVVLNMENPLCQNKVMPSNTITSTLEGNEVVVLNEKKDVCLLKLNKKPRAQNRTHWAGWDATGNDIEGETIGVHHPQGDARKISKSKLVKSYQTYRLDKTNAGETFESKNHWEVNVWYIGATQRGSSGSPLFDSNKRVVGCLTGGESTCSRPYNDYYFMIANDWDELSPYLDPNKTGQKQLDGAYHNDEKYGIAYGVQNIEEQVVVERPSDMKGYIAGHNKYGTSALAQRIETGKKEAVVEGLYIAWGKAYTMYGKSFEIALWSDNNGEVGEELVNTTVSTALVAQNNMYYYAFNKSVAIPNSIYAGIKLSYDDKVDTLAIYHQEGTGARFRVGEKWEKAQYFGASAEQALLVGIRYKTESVQAIAEEKESAIKLRKISEGIYAVSGDGVKTIEMYDTIGRREKTIKADKDYILLNIQDIENSIKIIRVNTDKERKAFRLNGK